MHQIRNSRPTAFQRLAQPHEEERCPAAHCCRRAQRIRSPTFQSLKADVDALQGHFDFSQIFAHVFDVYLFGGFCAQ